MRSAARVVSLSVLTLIVLLGTAGRASAQDLKCADIESLPDFPAKLRELPPAGSPPQFRCGELRAHPENETLVDRETYNYYVKTRSNDDPAATRWVAYDEDAILADGVRLWKTGFLDNYWIEVIEEPYANGVMGYHVVFHIEERRKLKGIEYVGSKKVEASKIEEEMKTKGIAMQIDSFLDMANVRRVSEIIKELYGEKGYQAAEVTPQIKEVEGSSKLVRLVYDIKEGPEVRIKEIVWDGNKAFKDKTLTDQIKENRPMGRWSWITNSGSYQEAKFADDAQLVSEFYQNHGFIQAQVGAPQIETIGDSKDGKKRFIRLRIPVDEGQQYRVGTMTVAGNTVFNSEPLLRFFKVKEGDVVSRKKLIKGLEELKKIYGQVGYWEALPNPDFCFRGTDCETRKPKAPGPLPGIVDITFQMNEGKRFYVHRITFQGNTTTHDTVIRRELQVAEGAVFNSEMLKVSVKRLNQLGYFKPVERAEDIDVQPTPGIPNGVDIHLKLEEQNRNQVTFGAGVSQYEGVFGQLGFQTSNFLGRGETLGINLQKGSQARNYQISFSEPYVFDRPITAGFDVYSREFTFISQYTQAEKGGDIVMSMPAGAWKRLSIQYGFQRIGITDVAPAYAGLLSAQHYDISRITPSFIYNTVDNPIFPDSGTRYTASVGIAGLGGNTSFVTTNLEGIWYKPFNHRTGIGLHLQSQFSAPFGQTQFLPVSERAYLGGEYSIRGFDLRSIGPRDPLSGVVLGGNKTLLFNAEYYVKIKGPVRFLLFYDAGEVRSTGEPFAWKEPITTIVQPPLPLLIDPNGGYITFPGAPTSTVTTSGYASAIKTSTGAELRFMMPVLNIPFRLIAAYNPQRFGVLTNKLALTPKFTFRFAVGTTF